MTFCESCEFDRLTRKQAFPDGQRYELCDPCVGYWQRVWRTFTRRQPEFARKLIARGRNGVIEA
jgi:hypothetical protein